MPHGSPGVTVEQQTVQMPHEANLAEARARARARSEQEFQPGMPTADRIAPLNQWIQDANRQATTVNRQVEALLAQAQGHANAGSSPSYANIQAYLNPHQKEVMKGIENAQMERLHEQLLPALRKSFIAAGHRGGAGYEKAAARLIRDVQKDIAAQQATLAHQGYSQALQAANWDAARQLESSQILAKLGLMTQGLKESQIRALREAGATEQEIEQLKRNYEAEELKRRQMHPYDMVNFYNSIISGHHYQPSTYTRTEVPGAPGLHRGDWARIGLEAARGMPSIFDFGRTLFGRKRGGHIRTPKPKLPRLKSVAQRVSFDVLPKALTLKGRM